MVRDYGHVQGTKLSARDIVPSQNALWDIFKSSLGHNDVRPTQYQRGHQVGGKPEGRTTRPGINRSGQVNAEKVNLNVVGLARNW